MFFFEKGNMQVAEKTTTRTLNIRKKVPPSREPPKPTAKPKEPALQQATKQIPPTNIGASDSVQSKRKRRERKKPSAAPTSDVLKNISFILQPQQQPAQLKVKPVRDYESFPLLQTEEEPNVCSNKQTLCYTCLYF
jgi:hypothetical protein